MAIHRGREQSSDSDVSLYIRMNKIRKKNGIPKSLADFGYLPARCHQCRRRQCCWSLPEQFGNGTTIDPTMWSRCCRNRRSHGNHEHEISRRPNSPTLQREPIGSRNTLGATHQQTPTNTCLINKHSHSCNCGLKQQNHDRQSANRSKPSIVRMSCTHYRVIRMNTHHRL